MLAFSTQLAHIQITTYDFPYGSSLIRCHFSGIPSLTGSAIEQCCPHDSPNVVKTFPHLLIVVGMS